MIEVRPRGLGGMMAAGAMLYALVIVGLGGAMYGFVHETIEAQLDQRIGAEAGALLASAQSDGYRGVARAVRAREARHGANDLGYIVLDPASRRIAGSLRAAPPPQGYFEFLDYRHADGRTGIAQSLNEAIPGGGRLIVAADREPVSATDRIVIGAFATTFGLILLIGLGGAGLFARMVQRRIARIGDSADAIMAGDFSRRMPVTAASDDFDRLSVVINRMLDRIEILLDNLRQVSADVAHDIRTPLNRLRGRIERADGLTHEEDVRATLGEATRDIDLLLELIESLLSISELEGSAVRKRFVRLDLAAIVEDVVDGYLPAIEDAWMHIDHAIVPGEIMGDAGLLRRCIANLLDNAILHAGAGARVSVRIERTGSELLLLVADDGPGIAEADRERIFDRFVRLDASRSKPGHGLGLNLVAAIAKAHMASVAVVPGRTGLAIAIRFPFMFE